MSNCFPKALIFDLDGLLVDSEPLAALAMARFLESLGVEQIPGVQKQLLGRRLPEAMAITQAGYGLPDSVESLTNAYGQMRLEALKGAVKPLPGAPEILAFARRHDLSIALATSGMREHADLSLTETGLAGLFDTEATGNEVAHGKPAPDLFLLAAERLNVEPGCAIVLEDSPLGVEAAITAGMRTIAVVRAGHFPEFPVEPTVIVSSLTEAQAWLKSLIATEQSSGSTP